jgi:hypothetical protein
MKQIPLTQGQFALVDDEDYEFLTRFKWHFEGNSRNRYAYTNFKNSVSKPRQFRISMGVMLLNTYKTGLQVDHIDGNGLNNQKENIRICNHIQNGWNRRKLQKCSSKYVGVSLDKKTLKWTARVRINGIRTYLGCFNSEEDAAIAVDKSIINERKNFAKLNILKFTL